MFPLMSSWMGKCCCCFCFFFFYFPLWPQTDSPLKAWLWWMMAGKEHSQSKQEAGRQRNEIWRKRNRKPRKMSPWIFPNKCHINDVGMQMGFTLSGLFGCLKKAFYLWFSGRKKKKQFMLIIIIKKKAQVLINFCLVALIQKYYPGMVRPIPYRDKFTLDQVYMITI